MDLKTPLVDPSTPTLLAPKPRTEYEAHLIRKQNDLFYNFVTWFKPSAEAAFQRNEDAEFVYTGECLQIYQRSFKISPDTLMEFHEHIDKMFPPPVFEIICDEDSGWHENCLGRMFRYKITIRWVKSNI